MIKKESIDRVIDAAQIVEVVSDFVPLKRRGANYIACCPFHSEKTPSFSVSPTRGIFKCFGCGKGGNSISFVMEHEQLSYVEAIKYLARKYNIEVEEQEESAEEARARLRSDSLYAVTDFAANFFHKRLLESDEGKSVALSYLKERGFGKETIEKFGLGWAPRGFGALSDSATQAGYKEEFLIEAGLSVKRDDGRLGDRFWERVIFPIHSISGRVIAFGGRTLKGEKNIAKYINSPESQIYHKSRSLYGIYQAKGAIVKEQRCYLVEGYTDLLSLHQAGVENVVASSGTALTKEQIRLIKRFAPQIVILFDGDSAGINASLRGIDLILEEGMEVYVALFSDGHDPDTYAKTYGGEALKDFIEKNQEDFLSFKATVKERESGQTPEERAKLINESLASIALIPDAISRVVYIEELAKKQNLSKELIVAEVRKLRREEQARVDKEQRARERRESATAPKEKLKVEPTTKESYYDAAERELLYYLIKYGESIIRLEEEEIAVADLIAEELEADNLQFKGGVYKRLFDYYFSIRGVGEQEIIEKELINHPESEVVQLVLDLLHTEHWLSIKVFAESVTPEELTLNDVVPKSLLVYKAKVVEMAYQTIHKKLAAAEKSDNVEEMEQVMREAQLLMQLRNRISKELNRLTI